jgi:Proteasome subunit
MSVTAMRTLPKQPSKPYIRPVPKPVNKGKSMTIAAGFSCSDGIVLCADSQITAQDGTKYTARKIVGYSDDNGIDVLFAFSGVEVFSKMCIDRLAKRVLASDHRTVLDVLRDEALLIHQTYAPQATAHPTEYDLDVLVAVKFRLQDQDVLGLFHIEGPAVSPPINGFVCIGIGRTVARQAVGLFYKRDLSVQEASRIAIYALQQTKKNVDACGGPSQVTMLWDDTDDYDEHGPSGAASMEQDTIADVEKGFDTLFESLRPVFLSFNNTAPHEKDFGKQLKKAAQDIKKIHSKSFGKIVRRAKKEEQELMRLVENSKAKRPTP